MAAQGKTIAFQTRAFAIMLVVMAGSVTCGPASAQYWGDSSSGGWGGWGWGGRSSGGWGNRYPSDRYYRRSPNRDFLSPFSGERPQSSSAGRRLLEGAGAAIIGNAAEPNTSRHRRFDGRLAELWIG